MSAVFKKLKRGLEGVVNAPFGEDERPIGMTPPYVPTPWRNDPRNPRNTMEMRTGEDSPAYRAIRGIQAPSAALDNPTVQGIQPPNVPVGVAEQAPQQGKVFDAVKRAVSQQPDTQGKDAVLSRTNMAPQQAAMGQQQGLGDDIEREAAQLRELEAKPVGFWKRFGSGLLSRAITRRGDEPIPITKRQRDIQRLRKGLGRDIDLQKAQSAIEASRMIDVQLDNGEIVRVPAKSAGPLQSQQQNVGRQRQQQLDRSRTTDARLAHWSAMEKRDRHRLILSEYNSGMLNDPALLEYAADELGLSGVPREKFIQGQMKGVITEGGDIGRQNMQTGEVTSSGVKSYEVPKEAGRNQRAAATLEERQREFDLKPKGGTTKSLPAAIQQTIAKGHGELDSYKEELAAIDEKIKAANALPADWKDADGTKNDYLASLGSKRAKTVARAKARMAELNQLDPENEWGSGEGGYPYRKPKAASDLNQPIYGVPTGQKGTGKFAGQVILMKNLPAAAKRLGMTTDQARKYLTDEGATVK